jgi:hypothetical protein
MSTLIGTLLSTASLAQGHYTALPLSRQLFDLPATAPPASILCPSDLTAYG